MEDQNKIKTRIIDYGYDNEEDKKEEDGSVFDRFADYIKQRQELARQRAKRVV